jgi:hypothetical protein
MKTIIKITFLLLCCILFWGGIGMLYNFINPVPAAELIAAPTPVTTADKLSPLLKNEYPNYEGVEISITPSSSTGFTIIIDYPNSQSALSEEIHKFEIAYITQVYKISKAVWTSLDEKPVLLTIDTKENRTVVVPNGTYGIALYSDVFIDGCEFPNINDQYYTIIPVYNNSITEVKFHLGRADVILTNEEGKNNKLIKNIGIQCPDPPKSRRFINKKTSEVGTASFLLAPGNYEICFEGNITCSNHVAIRAGEITTIEAKTQ